MFRSATRLSNSFSLNATPFSSLPLNSTYSATLNSTYSATCNSTCNSTYSATCNSTYNSTSVRNYDRQRYLKQKKQKKENLGTPL
jgi:hypothetical protein